MSVRNQAKKARRVELTRPRSLKVWIYICPRHQFLIWVDCIKPSIQKVIPPIVLRDHEAEPPGLDSRHSSALYGHLCLHFSLSLNAPVLDGRLHRTRDRQSIYIYKARIVTLLTHDWPDGSKTRFLIGQS